MGIFAVFKTRRIRTTESIYGVGNTVFGINYLCEKLKNSFNLCFVVRIQRKFQNNVLIMNQMICVCVVICAFFDEEFFHVEQRLKRK